MSLVTQTRHGGALLVRYANPPIGTMTAAGATEMLAVMESAVADASVRSIIITGGMPDIFIRHYDVGELSAASDALASAPAPEARPGGGRPGGERDLQVKLKIFVDSALALVDTVVKSIESTPHLCQLFVRSALRRKCCRLGLQADS